MGTLKFLGVYSRHPIGKPKSQRLLFFVWQKSEENGGGYIVQKLNGQLLPAEDPQPVDAKVFEVVYRSEPSILAAPVTSGKAGKKADDNLPFEPQPVTVPEQPSPEQTEATLREDFRRAMLRLKRPRERSGAVNSMEMLAKATDGIEPRHKHMFRDFCVSLRSNQMPELAVLFGQRTVDMSPDDDHAHFNLARILCILNKHEEALEHIQTAIKLNGKEVVYRQLLAYINRKKMRARSSYKRREP
ncbi:MAG: tetratricopeptide repeat protein [Desulfovibrio sp.]|nr:tetratricopeptide repeat protein [Desulfovibrio sp.]